MKQEKEKQVNIENGINLFKYLESLSCLDIKIRKSVKKLSNGENIFDLEDLNFLPIVDNVFSRQRNPKSETEEPDVFLKIKRYKIEEAPKLPKELIEWVDYVSNSFEKPDFHEYRFIDEYFDDSTSRKEDFRVLKYTGNESTSLKDWITKNPDNKNYEKIEKRSKKIFFNDFPELLKLYNDWIENKWHNWQEKNKKFFISNQAYDKFRELRSFLKTEANAYDLLWGHDILTWKNGEEEIYHPTFFTHMLIEFDSERNIITLRSDESTQTFFDISFIREALSEDSLFLSDIDDLAKRIIISIRDNEFNIWDFDSIHRYFEKLVHLIKVDGLSFYNKKDQELTVTKNPTFFNKHHLFLFKKTGKDWTEYSKKICEDIKKNKKLTPFLQDLVFNEVIEPESEEDENTYHDISNTELYFPLAYNDEQKRIANQIDSSYGSVVQGPPGTGKTHTIANLISRYLSLGKTILVSSQTGQALSVLKNKIPKGIRNMVVSQIESKAGKEDLQSSVSVINNVLSDTTNYTEEKKLKKIEELVEIRKKVTKKNKEFENNSLMDSNENILIGEEKISPIQAAKFIKKPTQNNITILDKINYKEELNITQEQIEEYISLLSSVNSEVWDFYKLDIIPNLEDLPEIEDLKILFDLKNKLNEKELILFKYNFPTEKEVTDSSDDLSHYIKEYKKYSNKTSELKRQDYLRGPYNFTYEKIYEMHNKINSIKNTFVNFNKDWGQELYKSIENYSEKDRWIKVVSQLDDLLKKYREEDSKLLGESIIISEIYKKIDYSVTLNILNDEIDKDKDDNYKFDKGVVCLVLYPGLKKIIKNIQINGVEISTQKDLKKIQSWFLREQIKDKLKILWSQAFANMTLIPEITDFNINKFDKILISIKTILSFEDTKNKILNENKESDIFKYIKLLNLDEINSTLEIFEGLLSTFTEKKYLNLIEGIEEGFKKENNHPVITLFIEAIQEKDIEKINMRRDELLKVILKFKESVTYHEYKNKIDKSSLNVIKKCANSHKAVTEFIQNVQLSNMDNIISFYRKIPDLLDKQNKSIKIRDIEQIIIDKIPLTIIEIKKEIKNSSTDIKIDIKNEWKKQRLASWLDFLHAGETISKINKDLFILKNKEKTLISELVEISSWLHLKKRVTKKQKEDLASFALSMKKYGKGTGKHAPGHLRHATESLNEGRSAVPVWIMPLDRIHKLLPNPKAEMFDIVIFDEASQIDARGLNIAYIGKKLLIVGDDEQVSPVSFSDQNKVKDLITQHMSDIPNSHHFSNTSSLFDIAKIKMTEIITLTEHFRSVEEIIGFSNSLSYNGQLKILRDQLPKHRLEPVLEAVFVNDGFEETNAKINKSEAEAVIQKIKDIINDEKYSTTDEYGETRPITIGVISLLGHDQSVLISKMISENISPQEIEKREIICGDPYVFQGDERDIILLSMVKAPDFHNPLKPISPYTVATKGYKQRINVAMSRAKNKMILFHSIPKDKLINKDDLRKKVIDWFYNNKTEIRKSGLQIIRDEVNLGHASEFEYLVAEIIINKGYRVIPQYKVAGYRIDLVIQGDKSKLAIECDGDQYHNRIDKWKEDSERQQILERSGWQFWRLSGSAFYRNQEEALNSLWEKLDELNINPE